MRIEVLLPHIHRRPTGGNLFNRQVLAHLDRLATVERRVVTNSAPLPPPVADVVLVDSLLLGAAANRPGATERPFLVLAHYLSLFEPALAASAPALAERRHLAGVAGVVTTSAYCRRVLVTEGLPEGRLTVATPGLAPRYQPEPAPRAGGRLRLLTVSTFLEGKGLRSLLGVLEGLLDLDWSWDLVGDDGLDPKFGAGLKRRLGASPVSSRLRCHGAVDPDRMVELYDRAHLFVLPSRFETCSMATMEAMARGLPVVAYRVGGLPERIPEATSHLLAPPEDAQALGAVLRDLVRRPEQLAPLGRANRRAARRFPSWEECGDRIWELVQRCAA